ncbi:PREDICTED: non-specific lipid-transfer protein-like protein At2g13820 [Ipomoea nil]|uniref:non-specific lipid-transfer protein-like protein At2g13820 n=1 Tax=Ipomoea nil TaxID=35883 RepID=UPI00090095C8|nr:PREDICTED: non-specific lipid-transfer protein-like protein At2g13820 [Ipomoea nil]
MGDRSGLSPPSSTGAAVDCNNIILNLADCITFVTNDSTEAKPQGSCCSGLKMVLKTKTECLCNGFKNSPLSPLRLPCLRSLRVSNNGLNIGIISSSPLQPPPSLIAVTPIGSNQVAPRLTQGDPPPSAMTPVGSIAATLTAAAATALLVVF